MDWTWILVIGLAGCLIGLSKGGLGGPMPVALTSPLLTLIMPTAEAVGLVLPLLIFADVFALRAYWKNWDWHHIKLMLPAGILGVILGVLLLASLDDLTLRHILGVFTMIIVVYKLASDRLRSVAYQPRNWHGWLAGGTTGFGSAIANAGAPPFTAYMLLQDVTPTSFMGTTTLFFAIINFLKLPGFLSVNVIDAGQLLGVAWVLPLIPLGVWLGRQFVERVSARLFEWLMMVMLVGASLYLLFGQ